MEQQKKAGGLSFFMLKIKTFYNLIDKIKTERKI